MKASRRELLNRFWSRVRSGEQRLGLLREYAAIVVGSQTAETKQKRRGRFARSHRRGNEAGECWCCASHADFRERHHVIQIQHGGTNRPDNIVSVCRDCHRAVHPWLHAR